MTTPPGNQDDPFQTPKQPPSYPGDAPDYPAEGGYPQQPGGQPYGQPMSAPEPPRTILTAVKLMYVGAGLAAAGILLGLLTLPSKDEIATDFPEYTSSEIDTAYTGTIIFTVVLGAIIVGLWAWMAVKNKQGRSWARVLATVLGGLNIVFTLIGIAFGTTTGLIINVISIALAGYILYLIYRPDSAAYYQAVSRSQQMR